MRIDDRLEGSKDFFHGLQELGLIRVLDLVCIDNLLNVLVHQVPPLFLLILK